MLEPGRKRPSCMAVWCRWGSVTPTRMAPRLWYSLYSGASIETEALNSTAYRDTNTCSCGVPRSAVPVATCTRRSLFASTVERSQYTRARRCRTQAPSLKGVAVKMRQPRVDVTTVIGEDKNYATYTDCHTLARTPKPARLAGLHARTPSASPCGTLLLMAPQPALSGGKRSL